MRNLWIAAFLLPARLSSAAGPEIVKAEAPGQTALSLPALNAHGGLILGVLAQPGRLAGASIPLNEWQHVAFSVLTPDQAGLGDPSIQAQPAAESRLEYKHTVRAVAIAERSAALFRHDYSWLALGATPEGDYPISFPQGPAFSVSVAHLDRSTPEERAKEVGKLIRDAWRRPETPVEFGPGVPERIQAFMAPHLGIMSRLVERHERYLHGDPVLSQDEKADKLRELASLKQFYADVQGGRTHYKHMEAVIAQVLACERSILRDYQAYRKADPASGKTAVGFEIEQIAHYREILNTLYEVGSQIDSSKAPGPIERLFGGALKLYMKFRLWLASRGR